MSHWEAILRWITKYNIKSILDAPCGSGSDHGAFRQAGVERILGIDLVAPEGPRFNWETHFLEAGWRRLEDEDDGQGHGSRQQVWGK